MHLTVAIVDFLTPYKRRRQGICSTYFTSIEPRKEPKSVALWIKKGMFELPALEKDMLLIGPGTGLAGMRAIIQERQFLGVNAAPSAADPKLGATHLYFGCRHEKKVRLRVQLDSSSY